MAIHQLQVAYQTVADRLLLRISTRRGEEYLAHLTRRLLREMWPALCAAMPAQDTATASGSTGGRFDKPYETPADLRHPLGRQPLLVAEGRVEALGEDKVRLVLAERRERSISVELDRQLLEVLRAMLRAGVRAADWGLSLDEAAGEATPPEPVPPRSGTLH